MTDLTLWNDIHDGGLRIELGHIGCPRDFHEGSPGSFPRVSRETQERLAEQVGDMMPQTPGEVSHVEVDWAELRRGNESPPHPSITKEGVLG